MSHPTRGIVEDLDAASKAAPYRRIEGDWYLALDDAIEAAAEQAFAADSPVSSRYSQLRGRAAEAQRSVALLNQPRNGGI